MHITEDDRWYIQQYWTVELDQGNVVVDNRWVIVQHMLNDFGRVANLFCAVGVKNGASLLRRRDSR